MHLMFKLGGMPAYANTKTVKVTRTYEDGSDEEFIVNAKQIMKDGDPEKDFPLEDGDRVKFRTRRIRFF